LKAREFVTFFTKCRPHPPVPLSTEWRGGDRGRGERTVNGVSRMVDTKGSKGFNGWVLVTGTFHRIPVSSRRRGGDRGKGERTPNGLKGSSGQRIKRMNADIRAVRHVIWLWQRTPSSVTTQVSAANEVSPATKKKPPENTGGLSWLIRVRGSVADGRCYL
jgi:hypothetical protein